MRHVPILRHGRQYRSMDLAPAIHFKTRQPIAQVSQANVGLIRRDLLVDHQRACDALAAFTTRELIALCARAGELFLNDNLDDETPQQYVENVSATTGMPHALARGNMAKINSMCANMETVLAGLTRNVPLDVLDQGYVNGDQPVSFYPRGQSLGVVLPSNSPGVHSLWIPSIALKTPLVLKPGSAEPWTPRRIINAFLKAGAPPEAFCYYPTDHAGANEILRLTGRGMLFGDVGAVKSWANDPRIELHGPGYSKVVIGEDCIDDWPKYIDIIAASIAANGGRSCVNASGVWVPRHADAIATALSEKLAQIVPRASDDPQATLAPFATPATAYRIDATLQAGGLPSRLAEHDGCTYLLPTIVRCDSPDHPLANKEFLFPFASVLEVPQESIPNILGPTLVVSAITNDKTLARRLLSSPLVGRLNIGALPTNAIRWDQPHEGNLFDHLYARRAFEMAMA